MLFLAILSIRLERSAAVYLAKVFIMVAPC
jgi:hypothetical protein